MPHSLAIGMSLHSRSSEEKKERKKEKEEAGERYERKKKVVSNEFYFLSRENMDEKK